WRCARSRLSASQTHRPESSGLVQLPCTSETTPGGNRIRDGVGTEERWLPPSGARARIPADRRRLPSRRSAERGTTLRGNQPCLSAPRGDCPVNLDWVDKMGDFHSGPLSSSAG